MYKSLITPNKNILKQTMRRFTDNKTSTQNFRVEHDTFGPINVPTDKYWAAQTQRSLQNFAIGTKEDKMPISVIRAMAIIKKAASKVK
jgi:fumarate hydratase, class II